MGRFGFYVGRPNPYPLNPHYPMFRWLIVVLLALILINGLTPWLQKLGFGKLPGDLRFKLFGRAFFLPLTTTIILSLLAAGIAKLL